MGDLSTVDKKSEVSVFRIGLFQSQESHCDWLTMRVSLEPGSSAGSRESDTWNNSCWAARAPTSLLCLCLLCADHSSPWPSPAPGPEPAPGTALLPQPPASTPTNLSLTPQPLCSPLPWASGPTARPGQSTGMNDPGESGWALATCLPSLGIQCCLKWNTCSLAIVTKEQKQEHF